MEEKLLYLKSWFASKYINVLGNKNTDFKSILVFKLDEIGDLVTSLHVFYNLHQCYPNASIHVVCKRFNYPFFKHLKYVKCYEKLEDLESNYDLIVDLRGNPDTLAYSLKNRPKYRLDRGSIRLKNKFAGGQKNELDTNLEIIQPLLKNTSPIYENTIVVSADEQKKVDAFIHEENLPQFVILHLGARDASRRWPIERFAACINYINTKYQLPCVLVGGPDDNALNNQCLDMVKSKHNYNVVGRFNLLEYAALCNRASLFIGNESGPVHIASAQNAPIIALFGPGVRNVFYPKGKVKIHHYFLARGHKRQTLANSTIFSITEEEVKESIDYFLGK